MSYLSKVILGNHKVLILDVLCWKKEAIGSLRRVDSIHIASVINLPYPVSLCWIVLCRVGAFCDMEDPFVKEPL